MPLQKKSEDNNEMCLSLDNAEFMIINNSLNEVAHSIRHPASDFVAWFGWSRTEASYLLESLRDEVDVVRLEPNFSQRLTVRMTLSDLELLRDAMIKTTNGEKISERAYHPRIGASLEEGFRLLSELERLLQTMAPSRSGVETTKSVAISGGIYSDPEELVLVVDETGLAAVVTLLRRPTESESLEIHPLSTVSGSRPLTGIVVLETDSDLACVYTRGDFVNISGSASALAGLADRIDDFAKFNDINSPGMHTHIDVEAKFGNERAILHPDSLPIFLAGPVSE